MRINRIHFTIDKANRAKLFEKSILRKYKNCTPQSAEVIVVIGGDGFMLHVLKKYQKYNKPFYGMNRGTFGFLMNKFKKKNIKQNISKAKAVSISPLEMRAKTKKGNVNKQIIGICLVAEY